MIARRLQARRGAGEVDRGPAREPDGLEPGALRGGRRSRSPSTTTATSSPSRPTSSRRSAPIPPSAGRHRDAGDRRVHRPVQDPRADPGLHGRVHQHRRQVGVPRAVGARDDLPRADDGHRRPRDRHRPDRVPARSTSSTPTICRTPPRPRWCSTTSRPTETLDQVVEMIDVDAFRAEQAAALAEGRLLGLGIAGYVEPSAIAFGVLNSDPAVISHGRQRQGAGAARHRQPRPQHRDHDRPGRRHPPRLRHRGRRRHPRRHRDVADGSGHRRQPHRGRSPAAPPRRRRSSCETSSSRSPPTCSRPTPTTSRSPTAWCR